MSESSACVNEILVNEIRGEDLKPISESFGEALSDEEPGVAMNASGNRFNTENGVIRDGGNGVLDPVEVFARRNGRVLAQVIQIAVELGGRQIRVDPIILQKARTPERTPRFGLGRFSGLPNADNSLWQQLRHGLPENGVVLMDQMLPQLFLQVLVEFGRVLVAELGSNLQHYDFGLRVGKELLDVVEDEVNAVGEEDTVADAAVFLDADVEDAGAEGELAVDGEGLALGEGASEERDANFVGCGVVGAGPDDLVDAEFLRVEMGHPVFSVLGTVVGARVVFSAAFQIGQTLLLCLDCLSSLHLFRHL